MTEQLPKYFEEYLEEKFAGLSKQITDFHEIRLVEMDKMGDELIIIDKKAQDAGDKADKANKNIIFWSGGIAVLVVIGLGVGGILALHFKQLNRVQVSDAVKVSVQPLQTDIDNLKSTVGSLQTAVSNIQSYVFDYQFIKQ